MKKLTAEEFEELSPEEKMKNYMNLKDGEMTKWRLLYDIPNPIPVDEPVAELTEEELEEIEKECKGFYEFIVREYERDIEHAKSDGEVKRLTKNMEKFKKEHNL